MENRAVDPSVKVISNYISDDWDLVDQNVIYGLPLEQECPNNLMKGDQAGWPKGEMDVMVYSGSEEAIGYIELKDSCFDDDKWLDKAETQVERAQDFWNERGFDFAGGYTTGHNIRPWNGSQFAEEYVAPQDFDLSYALSGGDEKDLTVDSQEIDANRDFAEDATHFYTNVVYGMPIETELDVPRGIAYGNDSSAPHGQMHGVFLDSAQDKMWHIDKSKDMEAAEGRLSHSNEFWEELGYEFEGVYERNGLSINLV